MADTLIRAIRECVERAVPSAAEFFSEHIVAAPPSAKMGDFSSNIALLASKRLHKKPVEVAAEIAEKLKGNELFSEVTVASPGFINVRVSENALGEEITRATKKDFGILKLAQGKKARVEFISANPTGPLHIGNARSGPLGDSIANVLAANGYTVLREYLHNDVGGQVEKLGQSLIDLKNGKEPEHYRGEYLKELAGGLGDITEPKEAGSQAVAMLFKDILKDASAMGIAFDEVYPESTFAETGQTAHALEVLKKAGLLKENEGATWFAPQDDFLKDREAVVIKSDGSYTYFANDIAYHNLKFSENYDLVVDELGAGHDGHIPKLKAAITALGHDISKFRVVVHQNVRVKRGNEVIKMSKRAGNVVTAREVIDEVGKDAFRFFMLSHDPNTHMDFDLELAKAKTKDNPVYYVQYAAVRCKSILRKIQNSKFNPPTGGSTQKERELTLALVQFPDLIQEIGESLYVHKLAHYALKVAGLFHHFYESERIIDAPEKERETRLALCRATLNVLGQCLTIMGISVPEKM